ncbi:MAG: hypothetical protein WHT29_09755 [Bacteroidales bacterium]
MKNKRIYNTGFNPDVKSHIGTSNEHYYYETTSTKDSLSFFIKNEQFIVEEPCFLSSEVLLVENIINPEKE